MGKKIVNAEALNIDGTVIEHVMQVYIEDKSVDNLKLFMSALKDAKFLVPGEFPKNVSPEIMEKIKKKQPIPKKDFPGLRPILMKNKEEKMFIPAFTSKKYLSPDANFPVILPVPFAEVLRVALAEDIHAQGILINPGKTKLILNPPLLAMMDRVMKGESVEDVVESSGIRLEKKKVKMTKDQFHVFVRRNVEIAEIPKRAFAEKQKFMDALYEERAELVMEMYRKLYPEKIAFPYQESDFDVMVLDISDTLSVASIGLPAANAAPGTCASAYVVFNPQTDEVQYFVIERAQEKGVTKLGQVLENGAYSVIGDAPAPGCEISGILELLESGGGITS